MLTLPDTGFPKVTFFDLLLAPFYILAISWLGSRYRNRNILDPTLAKYHKWGLNLKIFGAIAVGIIYFFYYDGGDTYGYFYGGEAYTRFFADDPGLALQFLFSSDKYLAAQYLEYVNPEYYYIYKGPAEILLVKITGIINLFTFNTYSATAIIFAGISFTGAYAMFRAFTKLIPALRTQFAIAIFFIPSVFFWGSGILKDCVTFGSLGWMVYAVYAIFIERSNVIRNAIILLISVLLISQLKAYILYPLLPAIIYWAAMELTRQPRFRRVKILIRPVFLIIGFVTVIILMNQLSFGKYSEDNLEYAAKGFQTWHTVASADGSAYTLNNATDYSISNLITLFPSAVVITLFRPFIWEAGFNPVMLLAALESLIILLFTLRIFFRVGPFRFIRIILTEPVVTFTLGFSLIFAFAVGITSYNFGALVRYKIPCIPFYIMSLYIIEYKARSGQQAKEDKFYAYLTDQREAEAASSL